jgi:hypothetical protein
MDQLTVIDTKFPDPDSQFRLRPCSCRSENVAYLQILSGDGKLWTVRCFACGKTGVPFTIRHDAQIYWNKNMAVMLKRKVDTDCLNLKKA